MLLSRSLRVSLYWLICPAFSSATEKSFSVSRSTASFPFWIRPEALMRGPILNTISLTVISRSESPQTSIIAFIPTLGLLFSCFSPWKARIRFSPIIGTMSEAILTATRSSRGIKWWNSIPLLIANACMNLKPTPQPERCVYGYVLSGRLAFRMATAGGRMSSGTWWSQMIKSIPFSLAYVISSTALMPQSSTIINPTPVSAA